MRWREGMRQAENLERKEQWSLPPRTCIFPRSRSCVDAGRLFTRGQVLPAFLTAPSETVGRIGPFSRTCLRHLTFGDSVTPRQKKNGPNERTDQNSRKNTTKLGRDSQPIRCKVQNTGYQDTHRIGWICSKSRWKNEANAKRNKGKCTGNQ